MSDGMRNGVDDLLGAAVARDFENKRSFLTAGGVVGLTSGNNSQAGEMDGAGGIERRQLGAKCSGIYRCARLTEDWLTRGLPSLLKISHSRLNGLSESDLAACGYQVLTRSDEAGVDIFAKQLRSRFIFFQGHPEYDARSLQREYMRDLARFLCGERDEYPAIPANYFDADTEAQLASFERRARIAREPTLAAELPGLTLRPNLAAGTAAARIFKNWLGFLGAPQE